MNIRYLLWKAGVDRADWALTLSGWIGSHVQRSVDLLEGAEELISANEKRAIARANAVPTSELSVNLLEKNRVNLLAENIRYLIDTLPHGRKKDFAKKMGVDPTTVSRWISAVQRPTKKKLDDISAYFGLPAGKSLVNEPFFLWLDPIGEDQMKDWILERIERMDARSIREIFPVMKRVLKE